MRNLLFVVNTFYVMTIAIGYRRLRGCCVCVIILQFGKDLFAVRFFCNNLRLQLMLLLLQILLHIFNILIDDHIGKTVDERVFFIDYRLFVHRLRVLCFSWNYWLCYLWLLW